MVGVNVGGEPGVAVGAACIVCASGGRVGSPGAGGVTVGSLLTSQMVAATDVGVPLELLGVDEAGATGEEIGRVGDGVTLGERVADRLGQIAITAKISTSPRIRMKRVRGFFMATRLKSCCIKTDLSQTMSWGDANNHFVSSYLDLDVSRSSEAARVNRVSGGEVSAPTLRGEISRQLGEPRVAHPLTV